MQWNEEQDEIKSWAKHTNKQRRRLNDKYIKGNRIHTYRHTSNINHLHVVYVKSIKYTLTVEKNEFENQQYNKLKIRKHK